ncbi:MAG: acyl-CoA desaturase, partial [Acidobacteriota bacterium]
MSKGNIVKKKVKGINWDTAVVITLFHLGAVAALFMFDWRALLVTIVLWWISASLGVGMGFHRLLTHRGYKTPRVIEYLLTIFGLLALEGGAINWVVTHRIHHAHTDAPGDPHSPRDGGWWAHMGWMLKGTAQMHDEETVTRYAPDLVKDRFHVLLNRLYWLPLVLLAVPLLVFGGWAFVLWAIFFRVTFNLHATWLVNSATHMWGKRRFATRDDSKNNWWVAL